MSASTSSKIGNCEPSPAGTCSPDWAMMASRPTVLSATVLPPVFGPVTTRIRKRTPRLRSIGTTVRSGTGFATGGAGSGSAEPPAFAPASGDDSAGDSVGSPEGTGTAGTGAAGTGFARAGSSRKNASSKGCLAPRMTSRDS